VSNPEFLHKELQQLFYVQLALCHAGGSHLMIDHLFGPMKQHLGGVKQHLGGGKLHIEVEMKEKA
jgi:hypothetical protein